MAFRLRVGAPALLGMQALSGYMAWRNYRALPGLSKKSTPHGAGSVSIIIPARDEAPRLPALLDSLKALNYPGVEILVIDDGSTDSTRAAALNENVEVLSVSGPPEGWTGKSFACWSGYQEAKGEWLLFTDADTAHAPSSLCQALATALEHNAGLVSLLAQQRCETFWERLLLPYAYALYFTGASRINRSPRTAVANGQYLLFRREVYERIGGHRSVKGSLIEDVALAKRCLRTGDTVVLARGEELLQVRMYGGLRQVWEGFSKNAVRFVHATPESAALTILASVAFLSALPNAYLHRGLTRWTLVTLPAACLIPWERRFGVSWRYAGLYPAAAIVFQAIAFNSVRALPAGRTRWKGRTY